MSWAMAASCSKARRPNLKPTRRFARNGWRFDRLSTRAIGPWCTTSIMLAVTSRSPCGLIPVIEVGAIARSVPRQPAAGDRHLFRGLPLLAERRKAKSNLHRLVIMDHRRLVAAIYHLRLRP